MCTVVKFLALGLAMSVRKNDKGEVVGKEDIRSIQNNHEGIHGFAPIGACYEGIGWIANALNLDPKKSNKQVVSTRETEVKRMVKGHAAAKARKEDDPQVLFTWQEWQDKAGFTKDENDLIVLACQGAPSYMFKCEGTMVAYRVSEETHAGLDLYIRESPIKSYNDIMLGIKKVYSNSKKDSDNGTCKTVYKMNEFGNCRIEFSKFISAKGIKVENFEEVINKAVESFKVELVKMIDTEAASRVEANRMIEEENKRKEEEKARKEKEREEQKKVKEEFSKYSLEDMLKAMELLKASKESK